MSMTFVTRSWFSLAGERDRLRDRDLLLSSSDILRLLRRLSAERLRLRDLSSSEAIFSFYEPFGFYEPRALACLGLEL